LAVEGGALDVTRIAQKDPNPDAQLLSHATHLESILRAGPKELNWLHRIHQERASYASFLVPDPVWRAPVTEPSKICAIGLNYLDHCKEQNVDPPKVPRLFAKYPSAIVGPLEDIVVDPALSEKVDYEAELAVVIGKKARHVRIDHAYEHVFGYLNANDVTARDLQKSDEQYTRSKSLDSFCPLGPWIATRDEVRDPHRLRIQTRLNGKVRQDSNTSNLIFGVDHLVSFLSQAFTLYPGDVILTGTPPGVGAHRDPPEFLRDDDRVEVEIDGLGVLENKVRRRAATR
jgi:2-keto-4-pentenoate hydratase/2-oxohepta-3-ene-1,7-dioic acid hydratase in catechol pathway